MKNKINEGVCNNCKYYNTCGDENRVESCEGKQLKQYQATDIQWKDGRDEIILPTEVDLPVELTLDGIDYASIEEYLSNLTGFLVISYVIEELE